MKAKLGLRAALAAALLLPALASAQAAKGTSFACLPKSERDRAEKLLAASRNAYPKAAQALGARLQALRARAGALADTLDEARFRGLMGDEAGEAAALARFKEAENAFLGGSDRESSSLAAPPQAVELARLIRAKALKSDPAALDAAERALESCFPKKTADALRGIGASFKAGGPSSHIAFLSCLCESWLLDPGPFIRLEAGEARSLNDSASVRKALGSFIEGLSAQKSFLARPLYFLYPPAFFLAGGKEEAREAFGAFIALNQGEGGLTQAQAFLDEGLRSSLADYLSFFLLLPDAAYRRLAERMGRPDAEPPRAAARGPAAYADEDTAEALGLILDFESALQEGQGDAALLALLPLLQDGKACAILDSSPRYRRQKKELLDFCQARLSRLAAQAYPDRTVRVSAGFSGPSLGAALLLKEEGGYSLPLDGPDLAKRLKSASIGKADAALLSRLSGCGRILSLSPLVLLPEEDARAFTWRFRLFGAAL